MGAEQETGGIVTTVKEETTKDLDVQERLAEQQADEKPADEKPEPQKQANDNDDDDDDELDFKALSPKQQKVVGRMFKTQRENTRKMRDLERQVTELSKKADTPSGEKAPVEQPLPFQRPSRPDPKDFSDDKAFAKAEEKYEDDLFDYRKKLERHNENVDKMRTEQEQIIGAFNDQAKEFAKKHEDYFDVMDQDTPMSRVMFETVLENGPALGYYLGSNPKEADRIYKMSERDARKALTRIVVKLEDEATPPEKDKDKGKGSDKKPDNI